MKISFFGAAQEVTGSKYLVESSGARVLVDCGLFQGRKEIRKRNWDKLPIDPSNIDAVVLTHAHIDHSGYIPVLVKQGFKGKIYCSEATFDLCEILLKDSGRLQEEDAMIANELGYSSHKPALPLYTEEDADRALRYFEVVQYNTSSKVNNLSITLIKSGHILGASFVIISDGDKTLTFSGDLGGFDQLVMKAPPALKETDYLVIESTYGNKLHEEGDPIQIIEDVVNKTVAKSGTLLIPAFAIGRTQTLLYCLSELRQKKRIPDLPIFLDSPMAINVTELMCKFNDEHKLSPNACANVFDIATYTRTVRESKEIDRVKGPKIIISASGMATGGRVLHHLKHLVSDSKNTVMFVGYQASGTLGRELIDGAKKVKIYGKFCQVNADIEMVGIFSAHADYNEILKWLGFFDSDIKKVFITHGELEAAQALQSKISDKFNWDVVVPKYLESFDL